MGLLDVKPIYDKINEVNNKNKDRFGLLPLYLVVMTNFMNLSFILMVTNLSTKIGLVFIVPSVTTIFAAELTPYHQRHKTKTIMIFIINLVDFIINRLDI